MDDTNDRAIPIDFDRHTLLWSTAIACMNAIPRKSPPAGPAWVLAE